MAPSPSHMVIASLASVRNAGSGLFDEVLSIYAGGSVFTADRYQLAANYVYGFQDWIDPTHYFVQPTAGRRVQMPTADSALANAISARFLGGQSYESTRPASSWAHLHSGVGMDCTIVGVPQPAGASRLWVCNLLQSANGGYGPGFMLYTNGSTPRWFVGIGVPGVNYIFYSTVSAYTPPGVGTYLRCAYKEGIATEAEMRVNGRVRHTQQTNTAPTDATTQTLTIGADAVGALAALFNFRALLIAAPGKILTPGEIATVEAWILATTGVGQAAA